MGYFYEIWEIFKKNLKKILKFPKKFKNMKNRKNISDLKKEPYLLRSPSSPWVAPFFFIFCPSSPKNALFYELISKVSETFKSSRKHCLVQNFV